MYNKRTWLNSKESDSTGSVVAFDGKVTDLDNSNAYTQRFLEISDCRNKIRLHKTSDDTDKDFLNKMKLLKSEIGLFINYLEKYSMNTNERYPMCTDQNAQIDCRIDECIYYAQGGHCLNVSPAITLTGKNFTCWSQKLKSNVSPQNK